MENRAVTMVMASFAADSLALGAHWVYDTPAIETHFGRVDSLLEPQPNSYHASKTLGDFTHYGDQMFVLLESLAAKKGFSLVDFSTRWRALFKNYSGYVDEATQGTLAGYESGKGPEDAGALSDELAGAARIAPLVYCYSDHLENLMEAVQAQTKMTHSDPLTVESAAFFAEVTFRVLGGLPPIKALKEVTEESFSGSELSEWVNSGLETAADDSVKIIAHFGQNCHTPEAFPGVIHLIAKYESDLKEALIQSVMAGGDSAARGMMVGMVLGAHSGAGTLPEEWVSPLNKGQQITELLQQLR
ncbi:MAG: ADP-ribosylglycohydrolase family protein [Deltaproteobacteria bacterium]|jgi:ADP-ribosylglycohydrolase|nr:ADP-ribosylglycohydrolase family protein [Deltaproteobacteria bacterium]